ncbi:MAG TPA: hypothetical protein VF101_19975 [Gaiellaceae bacterium]
MTAPASDPGDSTLADYIASRLARVGPYFAEPEIVHDSIAFYRDLWLNLYRLDTGDTPSDIANPS